MDRGITHVVAQVNGRAAAAKHVRADGGTGGHAAVAGDDLGQVSDGDGHGGRGGVLPAVAAAGGGAFLVGGQWRLFGGVGGWVLTLTSVTAGFVTWRLIMSAPLPCSLGSNSGFMMLMFV